MHESRLLHRSKNLKFTVMQNKVHTCKFCDFGSLRFCIRLCNILLNNESILKYTNTSKKVYALLKITKSEYFPLYIIIFFDTRNPDIRFLPIQVLKRNNSIDTFSNSLFVVICFARWRQISFVNKSYKILKELKQKHDTKNFMLEHIFDNIYSVIHSSLKQLPLF